MAPFYDSEAPWTEATNEAKAIEGRSWPWQESAKFDETLATGRVSYKTLLGTWLLIILPGKAVAYWSSESISLRGCVGFTWEGLHRCLFRRLWAYVPYLAAYIFLFPFNHCNIFSLNSSNYKPTKDLILRIFFNDKWCSIWTPSLQLVWVNMGNSPAAASHTVSAFYLLWSSVLTSLQATWSTAPRWAWIPSIFPFLAFMMFSVLNSSHL